jgi:gallate decarboxylase subunit D
VQAIIAIVGENRLRIEARATLTGRGIDVLLTGGESPHIGGVVMCVPRPNEAGPGFSCDTWVIPVTGHKEHHVAQPFGELICKATGQVTVVTAGIHIDQAQPWELEGIKDNCDRVARDLIERILNSSLEV